MFVRDTRHRVGHDHKTEQDTQEQEAEPLPESHRSSRRLTDDVTSRSNKIELKESASRTVLHVPAGDGDADDGDHTSTHVVIYRKLERAKGIEHASAAKCEVETEKLWSAFRFYASTFYSFG